jgi:uncharacterized protein (DUF362 family)
MSYNRNKFYISNWENIDKDLLYSAISSVSKLDDIRNGTRIFIKPNFTFPFFKKGVTTPPDLIKATVEIMVDLGANVTIGEGGASLNVFDLQGSFADHGLYDLEKKFGIKITHLREEKLEYLNFGTKRAGRNIPIPKILLEDTDLFINLPIAKVHSMTTVTLAFKNLWGCIAAHKRFLFHPAFNDIIAGLSKMLPPQIVICDGRWVLTDNGPMFGVTKRGQFLATANDTGVFDIGMCRLMGYDPLKINHLRHMIRMGLAPISYKEIECNSDPAEFRPCEFVLNRTLQNYIALAGFKSSFITWFGYDSFASGLLHKILYAIKPNPLNVEMLHKKADAQFEPSGFSGRKKQ